MSCSTPARTAGLSLIVAYRKSNPDLLIPNELQIRPPLTLCGTDLAGSRSYRMCSKWNVLKLLGQLRRNADTNSLNLIKSLTTTYIVSNHKSARNSINAGLHEVHFITAQNT